MEKGQEYLGREKIGKLMMNYSLPCIISLLVGALYNIVDQIFISNATDLGSYGNAANTIVYPLTVVALAICVMIGDGCCVMVSNSFGRKDAKTANKSFGNAITMIVISGVVLCAVYLIFRDQLITVFGGNANGTDSEKRTFELAQEYFLWISVGIPLYMFGQGVNPMIRSDGSPRFAMACTLAGAVTNIILDPIFIFACKWGMMGAAVATVIGQGVTAAMSLWYMFHLKDVHPKKADFSLSGSIVQKEMTLGITSFLSQISVVFAMMAMNNMVSKYGATDVVFGREGYTQIPMAVLGIVMKFFQIIISIVVGLAAGSIPLLGYNMGAGLKNRVKEIFTRLLVCEAIVGAVSLFIVEVLPGGIIAIFGAGKEVPEYTSFALDSFRIYLCMMVVACINKSCFISLQGMGKVVPASILSLIREIVFGVGFTLLLPPIFAANGGRGLYGVLWSMPLSELLTAIIAAVIIVKTYKSLQGPDKALS